MPTTTKTRIIFYTSVDEPINIAKSCDLELWITLLNAAVIRNYSPIFEIYFENVYISNISYHLSYLSYLQ